jgi:hypothetical protein
MAGQEEITEIPTLRVKCPKCKSQRDYTPKRPGVNIATATFTCKKCKHKSKVKSNQVRRKSKKQKATKPKQEARKRNGSDPGDSIHRPLPVKDPGFEKFARWFSIPQYKGLHNWQKEHHYLTWKAEYEMTLVPRDHGKSVEYMIKYQWAMQWQEMDVLLLGWTDRRKEVAMYVYSFFAIYDLIERDKRTSPFHFRLKNGGKFDCYLITSKETLGMHSEGEQARFKDITEEEWLEFCGLFHNVDMKVEAERSFDEAELREYVKSMQGTNRKLWISIDDPIDISFMKERHKEETLELHFQSSLYPIHPFKWSFTGTCKFEEDFFHFIKMTFGNQLVVYKRGTRNEDGSLLCPERFTAPDQASYAADRSQFVVNAADMTLILDPEGEPIPKTPKRDLDEVRRHVGEYAWWSEYEQDPHPVTGEVWDGIEYELMLDTPVNRKYDLLIITIDRATTLRTTSDYTGCIFLVREKKRGIRIVIEDLSDNISFDDLLFDINEFVIEWHRKHENMTIIMVVEKQGGGDDFITMAKNLKVFVAPDGTIVKNMIPEIVGIEPIHNTGEKLERIKQRLFAPIKNGKCRLLKTKKGCEVEKEILSYPYPAKLDAIDALANAEFMILEKYHWVDASDGGHLTELNDLFERMETRKRYAESYGDISAIEEYEESRGLKQRKKRGIFD